MPPQREVHPPATLSGVLLTRMPPRVGIPTTSRLFLPVTRSLQLGV